MEGCVPQIPVAMTTPCLNRGVGFSHAERRRLGLTGRLPSAVLTLEQQANRAWQQLQGLPTDLARNLLLDQLHYRHEVLYFKVLCEHLTELLPVVYTPTVGEAIQRFSDEYRGQRRLYLSIDGPDEIAESLETFGLGPDDVALELLLTKQSGQHTEGHPKTHRFEFEGRATEQGEQRFVLELKPEMCGKLDYRIRVYPCHELLTHPFELGLMTWV